MLLRRFAVVSIAVVHLVRLGNAPADLDAFIASLAAHDAGAPFDLVLLWKSFADAPEQRAALRERVGPELAVTELDVSDAGFDLTAYAAAAARLPHDRLCFMNSRSVVLAEGWLAHLDAALDAPNTGAAGATGSWQGSASLTARLCGVRNEYAEAFPDRRRLLEAVHAYSGGPGPRGPLAEWAFALSQYPRLARRFPAFPAAHLRTNAFLVGGERFGSLAMGDLRAKEDAHLFEHGRASMTAQLAARGLDAVTVDRYGTARRPADWHEADGLWQADQGDLLVADNQTRAFDQGSDSVRWLMSGLAWGTRARPKLRDAGTTGRHA